MPLYESVFILKQDVPEQEVRSTIASLLIKLQEKGGTLIKEEYWGLRPLACKIKNNERGHYVVLAIDASHEAVQELETYYKVNEEVIRFLTLKVKEIEKTASIMMQSSIEKDR
ncbi:30S ribosomal protein S6 [Alphaproteobacteria bacterium]